MLIVTTFNIPGKNINIYTLFKSGKSMSYIDNIYTKFKAFDKFQIDNYSKQIFII